MKKLISLLLASFIGIFAGCSTTSTPDPGGGDTWNLTVSVDLGGAFTVLATAKITYSGTGFTAVVTTSKIGGAAEVHNMTMPGMVTGQTHSVSGQQFTITVGTTTETVNVTGTFTINGNTLSGSGTMTVDNGGGPMNGTFTVSGTK